MITTEIRDLNYLKDSMIDFLLYSGYYTSTDKVALKLQFESYSVEELLIEYSDAKVDAGRESMREYY